MKYAVISISNGNFAIVSEWDTEKEKAIISYHDVCRTLWNAPDVEKGCVAILTSDMTFVPGYIDYIKYN